jgi:protein-tyrosine phosphatase
MQDLDWEACYNARDLGSYPTADGGTTRRQVLIRADNLVRLTPAGQAALRAYGVRTIIDLRLANELVIDPSPFAPMPGRPAAPRYLHLPLHDPTTDAIMDAAESTQAGYIVLLEHCKAQVAAVIQAVAAGLAEGGVVFHCHGGKDRTGLVAALLLALVGVARQAILADYAHSATRLEGPYSAWLAEQAAAQGHPVARPRWMQTPPETMQAVLDYLDQTYGGVPGYLAATGVSPATQAQIRAYFVSPPEPAQG